MNFALKSLLIFSSIATPAYAKAQTEVPADGNYPFQVIAADRATKSNGQELKSFDLLSLNDAITVRDGGIVSMLHYNGIPLEFSNDTTIIVALLHGIVDPPRPPKSPEKKTRKTKSTEEVKVLNRPNLESLLITEWKVLYEKMSYSINASHDVQYSIQLIEPPAPTRRAFVRGDACFKWEPPDKPEWNDFSLELTTIFDEPIKSLSVNTNELHLDSAELSRIFGEHEDFIVNIQNPHYDMYQGSFVVSQFKFKGIPYPYNCNSNSATVALLTGFVLEMYTREHNKAEVYYERAASLSEVPFFKDMLTNYHKRSVVR